MSDRLDAGIPVLLVNGVGIAAGVDERKSDGDLRGLRASREDLGNERIGIERNRAEHLIELGGGKELTRGRGRRSVVLRMCQYENAEGDKEEGAEQALSFHYQQHATSFGSGQQPKGGVPATGFKSVFADAVIAHGRVGPGVLEQDHSV